MKPTAQPCNAVSACHIACIAVGITAIQVVVFTCNIRCPDTLRWLWAHLLLSTTPTPQVEACPVLASLLQLGSRQSHAAHGCQGSRYSCANLPGWHAAPLMRSWMWLQAVQYIEAMVGRTEAYAQYERLMRAAKSATFRPPARRVMPALHSY